MLGDRDAAATLQIGEDNFSRIRFEYSSENTVNVLQLGTGNTSNVSISGGSFNSVNVLQAGM
jgi:hypothetical protein